MVRYCRECNRETRHWRSELEELFPYPGDWRLILLLLVIWLLNQAVRLPLVQWHCVECGNRRAEN